MSAISIEPGQVVAKLDPQDELNALRAAQAGVAAAEGATGRGPQRITSARRLCPCEGCRARAPQFERARQAHADRPGPARYRARRS